MRLFYRNSKTLKFDEDSVSIDKKEETEDMYSVRFVEDDFQLIDSFSKYNNRLWLKNVSREANHIIVRNSMNGWVNTLSDIMSTCDRLLKLWSIQKPTETEQ